MPLWLAIPCGVGPCFVWMWLIHRRDDHEREPWPLVLGAMALGALATAGVLCTRNALDAVFDPVDPWWRHVDDAFFVTALGEEAWKLLALLPLLLHRELDEPLDGAVYGAAVGLGFAGAENVVYADRGGDLALLLQRAFTATLVHATCTGCLGFGQAMGKLRRFGRGRVAWLVVGLVVAVVLHGLYDFFLDGARARMLVSLLLVLPAALILLALKVRWARARSERYHR